MKVEYAIHNLIGTRVQAEGAAKGLRAYGWNPAEVVPVVRVSELVAELELLKAAYDDPNSLTATSAYNVSCDLLRTLTDVSLKEGT